MTQSTGDGSTGSTGNTGGIGAGRPLVFGPQGVSLGRWGTLVSAGAGTYAVVNPKGGRRLLDFLPPDLRDTEGWLEEESGIAVLAANYATALAVFSLALDEPTARVELDREPDVGLRFTRIVPATDHLLVCLYERGIVAIEDDGAMAWHTPHDDLSVRIASIDPGDGPADGLIWLERQWPPTRSGSRFAVRMSDGRIVG